MSLNHVSLMGRATGNAELRSTNSGINSASFSLAVDRDFSKDKTADFINCVAWRSTADFAAKYVRKGGSYAVTGRLQTRSFETKDGTKRTVTEVVVDNIYFAGSKVTTEATDVTAEEFEDLGDDPSDLPF